MYGHLGDEYEWNLVISTLVIQDEDKTEVMEVTARHPMRVAAYRTGLSPYLIRMWERRYQAVQPERTETNRRMYSDEDIERLILLRHARDAGESLAQIAKLSNDELREMVRSSANSFASLESDILENGLDGDCLQVSMKAIRNLDQSGLESCLLEARVTMQPQRYLERVIIPLLEEMGEAWSRGEARVAHEHLASAVVRSVLGTIMVTNQADESAPLLVSTTLPGQLHELGALMAAVTAVAIGWRIAYLGPNLPAEDIAAVAKQGNAKAIALSVLYPPDDPRVEIELKELRRSVGEELAIIIGGRSAANYRAAIDSVGAEIADDLRDLIAKLFSIRAGSSPHEAREKTTR